VGLALIIHLHRRFKTTQLEQVRNLRG